MMEKVVHIQEGSGVVHWANVLPKLPVYIFTLHCGETNQGVMQLKQCMLALHGIVGGKLTSLNVAGYFSIYIRNLFQSYSFMFLFLLPPPPPELV